MKVESAYIHIPFCKNICSYCDFCKMYYNSNMINLYLEELEKEVTINYKKDILKTLYVGGGTPSCLNLEQLTKLFSIIDIFNLDRDYEFTFECNINDISIELLSFLKSKRVNRISIGIETINDKFYKLLNRYNNKEDIIEKINLVKRYFNNINIDLMYGFYNETIEDLDKDIDFFLSLDIPHISLYSLILEENTKLYIDNIKTLDSDCDSDMYYHIIDRLKENNYIHYEISNFSKDGYSSKHNLTYWSNNTYYGFGLGSSGYIDNIRYSNTRSLNHYLEGNYRLEEETISNKLKMEYEMILGLRKVCGVSKDEFFKKYNLKIEDVFDIIDMINNKYLEEKDGYLYIPEDKLYISNSFLINFVGGVDE